MTFKTLWVFIKSVLQNHIFLVIDTALTWDNSSRFRKNLRSLIVTTDDKSKDEKLQFDINRKPAKISALSSSKIEYLTGKEMLWSDQIRMIQPAEFTYSPFSKAFEQQIRIEEQEEKQLKELEEHRK